MKFKAQGRIEFHNVTAKQPLDLRTDLAQTQNQSPNSLNLQINGLDLQTNSIQRKLVQQEDSVNSQMANIDNIINSLDDMILTDTNQRPW